MKRTFTLAIPTPCHEKWSQFTPTPQGGYCGSCKKEVIDFTTWSEDQIKQYFLARPTATCGRFAPHQLTTYKGSRPPAKLQPRWAAALACLLVLLSRPAEAQPPRTRAAQEQVDKTRPAPAERDDTVARLSITGVITSGPDGELLPGVNVVRKGTTQGTVTDADGKFDLVIDQPRVVETLVASFIGLTTVEYEVVADTPLKEIKITMPYDLTGGITLGGVVATRWYSPRGLWWRVKGLFRR